MRLLWGNDVLPLDEFCARVQPKCDSCSAHFCRRCRGREWSNRTTSAIVLPWMFAEDIETIFQSDQLALDFLWG